MQEQLPVLEGLLFLAGDEGIAKSTIMNVLEIGELEFNALIQEFKEELDNYKRGLNLVELGEKYKLATKAEHFDYYQKLVDNPTSFTFSNAALETLAIIAYNQPITRAEIENIRGVSSDGMVRKLLTKSLIKEVGRKDSIGKPMLYEVTNEFMDVFNLTSLKELPDLENVELDEEEQDIFNTKFIESVNEDNNE